MMVKCPYPDSFAAPPDDILLAILLYCLPMLEAVQVYKAVCHL